MKERKPCAQTSCKTMVTFNTTLAFCKNCRSSIKVS